MMMISPTTFWPTMIIKRMFMWLNDAMTTDSPRTLCFAVTLTFMSTVTIMTVATMREYMRHNIHLRDAMMILNIWRLWVATKILDSVPTINRNKVWKHGEWYSSCWHWLHWFVRLLSWRTIVGGHGIHSISRNKEFLSLLNAGGYFVRGSPFHSFHANLFSHFIFS